VARRTYLQLGGLVLAGVLIGLAKGSAPWPAVGQAAALAGAVLLTLAWHEAGHALAARACGLRVHGFAVRGVLGGVTVRDVAPRPGIEVLVILAGPLASALLGLAGLGVALLTSDPFAIGRILAPLNLVTVLGALTIGIRSDGARARAALRAHRRARRERLG